jgi:hypothetical protein
MIGLFVLSAIGTVTYLLIWWFIDPYGSHKA